MRLCSIAVAALCCLAGAATAGADTILPNGRRLTPAGQQIHVGQWPETVMASPDGTHLLVLNPFAGPQLIDWIDTATLTDQPIVPIDPKDTPPDGEFDAFSL